MNPKAAFETWFEEKDDLIWDRDWAEFITLVTHEAFKAESWARPIKYSDKGNKLNAEGWKFDEIPGGFRCTARPQPEPEPEPEPTPEPEPAAPAITPEDWKAFQEFMAFREFQAKRQANT